MDYPRDTDAYARASFGYGQSPGGEIRRVADLAGDLQDPLACRLFDSVAPVRRGPQCRWRHSPFRRSDEFRVLVSSPTSLRCYSAGELPLLFYILTRANGNTTLNVRAC